MKSKYENLDTIIYQNTNGQADIQYIEYEGTLKREEVSSSSGTVRSNEVFGRFQLPKVGKRFSMVAEPFDKNFSKEEAVRMVSTSVVKRVERDQDGVINFWTENSKYLLTLER
ncbi:MAG: hypothetical protein WDA09_02365 [Bacteriovoracaceae bacterium]